ncbi:uncharacterized mitochondrial protein AtMg00810-like [Cornus florida]|uniref:uncharacterized mitochondrial protein AtMg00810-like n=1 Tax=Cornus florida TaxID=4283 RepID=UPI00289DED7A|nr:uncharacterized mitochondrial protein AtMg00810-like [Cornus florida]
MKRGIVILVVYVDDIVIIGSDKDGIQVLIHHLSSGFLIKDLGKLWYFLGIKVARLKQVISLSQWKYTLDLLQDTGYLSLKPVVTPVETNVKLKVDDGDPLDDPEMYRRLILSVVSQSMTSPRVPYMEVVVCILKYLKGALGRGLLYRSSGHLRIKGCTDTDWAGSLFDRRSTTGYCTFIRGSLVTWRIKKQLVVARSSAEAEYRAMSHTACELG